MALVNSLHRISNHLLAPWYLADNPRAHSVQANPRPLCVYTAQADPHVLYRASRMSFVSSQFKADLRPLYRTTVVVTGVDTKLTVLVKSSAKEHKHEWRGVKRANLTAAAKRN